MDTDNAECVDTYEKHSSHHGASSSIPKAQRPLEWIRLGQQWESTPLHPLYVSTCAFNCTVRGIYASHIWLLFDSFSLVGFDVSKRGFQISS